MKIIPYGKQFIDSKDISAVVKSLKEDKITTGPYIEKFEKKVSSFLKCNYTTVCNSGTSAIYLALRAIDLKEKDSIIMPAMNFIASYNIAKLFRANVYFADVDKITGQVTPDTIIDCYKKYKLKKIKAIIVMYNGGYPQNNENFLKIKKKFKCFIIEDACHALGAAYKIKKRYIKVGSCEHSDISTFSLHPLKTITTGEGGIVTTNSKKLNHKLKLVRSHGILKSKHHWKYNIIEYGLNLRLNDFQCALGISQLKKITKFIKKRKQISLTYDKFFSKLNEVTLPKKDKSRLSSHHLYIIHLANKKNLKNKFLKYMLKKKIYVQYHYIPIYKFNIFNGKLKLINTENYFNSAISLPIFFDLSKEKQMYVIKSVYQFFKKKIKL